MNSIKVKVIEADDSKIPLPVIKLMSGSRLPFDVFVNDSGIFAPLFNKGTLLNGAFENVLNEKGIYEVYVSAGDKDELDAYLSIKKPGVKDAFRVDARLFNEYSFYKQQYFQIDKSLMARGSKIGFSLFVLNGLKIESVLEATEDFPSEVDAKVSGMTGSLLIKISDIPQWQSYISSIMQTGRLAGEEGLKIKTLALKENSKIVIKDLLENPRSGENINRSKTVVADMVDCISEKQETMRNLLTLRGSDYYTYTHSVNVAVLSIGLGVAANMDKETVQDLGVGAMLHDIGKSAIPHHILNKQGKLDYYEFEMMKTHVAEGERILELHNEIGKGSYPAVSQHHEKLSGRGYPLKLSGGEIKTSGRITAIADCYDALTTDRPYKPAYTPFYALSLMTKETRERHDFDTELLVVFIKMIGNYK